MRKPLSTAFLLLLSAALVIFGFFYGAYRGWSSEAARVDKLFHEPDGLEAMLTFRANDAANLEKVALRHLDKNDPLIHALLDSRAVVMDNQASLSARYLADVRLGDAVAALAKDLLNRIPSDTVKNRDDRSYVRGIQESMQSYASSGAADAYNAAAADYNLRFSGFTSGWAAKLFAVIPAQVFGQEGER
jgi:hypothetical protein